MEYKDVTCRGSIILGTACGKCEICKEELASISKKLEKMGMPPELAREDEFKSMPLKCTCCPVHGKAQP